MPYPLKDIPFTHILGHKRLQVLWIRSHQCSYLFLSERAILHKLVGNDHEAVIVLKLCGENHGPLLQMDIQVFFLAFRITVNSKSVQFAVSPPQCSNMFWFSVYVTREMLKLWGYVRKNDTIVLNPPPRQKIY